MGSGGGSLGVMSMAEEGAREVVGDAQEALQYLSTVLGGTLRSHGTVHKVQSPISHGFSDCLPAR